VIDFKNSIFGNSSSKQYLLISKDFKFVKKLKISSLLTSFAEKESILDGSKIPSKSIISSQVLMKICYNENNPRKRLNDLSSRTVSVSNFGRLTVEGTVYSSV
jgi:hypothetical protein